MLLLFLVMSQQQNSSQPQGSAPGTSAGAPNKNQVYPSLYVGNLPDKAFFDLDLKKLFEDRGYSVKNAKVISAPIKQEGKNPYGYVSLASEAEIVSCLAEMNNFNFKGQQLIINRQGDNVRNPDANIIIRNIPKHVTQA